MEAAANQRTGRSTQRRGMSPFRPWVRRRVLLIFIFAEAEGAGFCGVEKRTRPGCVPLRDQDLDGPEAVERQSVRVSQRLTALDSGNARCFEKRADLLRVHCTTGDENALQLRIHGRPVAGYLNTILALTMWRSASIWGSKWPRPPADVWSGKISSRRYFSSYDSS